MSIPATSRPLMDVIKYSVVAIRMSAIHSSVH